MEQRKLQRAILVNVIPPESDKEKKMAEFDELKRLVETYGGIVILKILQKRGRPSAKTYIGEGKAQEVATLVKELKADVVVINGFLKANQSNNLINIIPCEVLDRFEMILKIFEKHAESPEAKMQLQIAYLKYEFPKLFGSGAVLSQQAAGIAGIRTSGAAGAGRRAARGPGETILEVKRRHLRNQINTLEKKIKQLRKVRTLQRDRRKRREFFTAALVGYTNSGKSTLMQALSKKRKGIIADKLFSTLDTRLGKVYIPDLPRQGGGKKVLIADTIGFIQDLPPLLFESFLATLEEVQGADLLLHVVDVSDPQADEKIDIVNDVLMQLHVDDKPMIYVFNKIDKISEKRLFELRQAYEELPAVFVSALKKRNLDELIAVISSRTGKVAI
ncbi:GTPase HflX [Candidatus Peregrinibacteria bacterium CG11_big_fil_rev_8_21_14_0_20_46_8]|nr:MAG: GTPase HflX [Candidatus Peregrinibacteria bacterium CG11_big_fil_rev_8_21_14_0_20_46_8]